MTCITYSSISKEKSTLNFLFSKDIIKQLICKLEKKTPHSYSYQQYVQSIEVGNMGIVDDGTLSLLIPVLHNNLL